MLNHQRHIKSEEVFFNKYIVFVIVLFTGLVAKGQRVLTLEEAVNTALKNSYDIQISRNTLEADRINNNIGVAGGLPTVNASLTDNQSLTTVNQELNDGRKIQRAGALGNALNAGVTGSYLLFNGFRVHATKSRLEALEKLSEQQVNVQIQNTIANVVVKYYDIVRQQSYMKTLEQSIAVTEQRRNLAEARKSVGLANNADTYQAQIDLNSSLQELQNQKMVVVQAKTDLMNLMEQQADTSFIISDTIIFDSLMNLEDITYRLRSNPEILSAAQQIRVNQYAEREVAAQRYPALRVNAGYNYNRNQSAAGLTLLNQNFGPFIGLNVQVPIFNGGVFKRQQRVAEINTRSSELQRSNIANNIESAAARSWYTLQNTLQQIKMERENYRLARALLDLTLQRYQLIAATIVEVREAQRSFTEAGYRLVNLSYAAKLAEVELKRLASQLAY
jgi:outer membrane protein TolC